VLKMELDEKFAKLVSDVLNDLQVYEKNVLELMVIKEMVINWIDSRIKYLRKDFFESCNLPDYYKEAK